jgi:hypothetical protein
MAYSWDEDLCNDCGRRRKACECGDSQAEDLATPPETAGPSRFESDAKSGDSVNPGSSWISRWLSFVRLRPRQP